ncbi:7TM receptor with intracellular metal dependent phosphohydrolase [Paenibacillus swuensis]|uniref:7TM receptor with intracellular metal dependent phosphohydrolase n=1 Tax=Paenibacillus swuensis TaxID=1178515 RepID=A0A172TJX0_9BACL|nr:HDIG domain-containing metalloprotein [Paenibacillus swuensis]ANE47320.1 7TM receptor with intracellular metal dependent phosphohydrolase [Paenibacillus swuensis]
MIQQHKSFKEQFQYQTGGWKYSALVRFLLFLALWLLLYFSFAGKLIPERYDIQLNVASEKTIWAPEPLENEKATLKAQDEAAESVDPVETFVSLTNENLVQGLYDKLEQLNADTQVTFDDKVNIYRRELPQKREEFINAFLRSGATTSIHSESLLAEVKKGITEQEYRFPEDAFFKLPRLSNEDLEAMRPVTVDVVNEIMKDERPDAQAARAQVAEIVNTSNLTKNTQRKMVQEIARFVITPNVFFDKQATEEARAQARENTPAVMILKGEELVKKGEVITKEKYELLNEAGLLRDKVNYMPQVGLILLVTLMVLLLVMYIMQRSPTLTENNSRLAMLVLIYFLNIMAMKLVSIGQTPEFPLAYLAPVALGSMLITLLLDIPLAFLSSVLFSLAASIIFNTGYEVIFDFRIGFVSLLVCFSAIFALHKASQRSTILKAGVMVCLVGAASVTALNLLSDEYNLRSMLQSISLMIGSGLLTAVLVIGLMPFFEVSFGILSALKLVELSNPNHPLLRKLLTETPGTYHHSVMVGNLSEAAAESIGANGLLCRVGSFYHDIGKTKRPSYFIENQSNIENPHDLIDPKLSKSIIIAHARDGVEMLKDHKIPRPIWEIAEQHHGTTLLKYFYHKARKMLEDEGKDPGEIKEEDFRYFGPKAQSKEAAIVGIADCVEAAVRSLRNPTVDQIESMVQKIIKNRLDDHQFNECDLTLKELDKIAITLKETLLGIFHSRIEYPEDLTKSVKKGEA